MPLRGRNGLSPRRRGRFPVGLIGFADVRGFLPECRRIGAKPEIEALGVAELEKLDTVRPAR
jgi:hypothetical protein